MEKERGLRPLMGLSAKQPQPSAPDVTHKVGKESDGTENMRQLGKTTRRPTNAQDRKASPGRGDAPARVTKWFITKTTAFVALTQATFCILFTALVSYNPESDPGNIHNSVHPLLGGFDHTDLNSTINELTWMSMSTLVWAGLRVASVTQDPALCNTYLLVFGVSLQWSLLCNGFIRPTVNDKMQIGIRSIIEAQMTCLSLGVAMTTLIGILTTLQLVCTTVLFVPVQVFVRKMISTWLKVADRSESLGAHLFGSTVGVAIAAVVIRVTHGARPASTTADPIPAPKRASPSQEKTTFLASLLLFITFPWIGGVASEPNDIRRRVFINTFVAMTSAATTAFPVAAACDRHRRYPSGLVETGLIGAAVGVGVVADLKTEVYGAALIGTLCCVVSIIGHGIVMPRIQSRVRWVDGRGVWSAHAVPVWTGSIARFVLTSIADSEMGSYGYKLYQVFPAMCPAEGSPLLQEVQSYLNLPPGLGRSPLQEVGMWGATLFGVTVMALFYGAFVGWILCLKIFRREQTLQPQTTFVLQTATSPGQSVIL